MNGMLNPAASFQLLRRGHVSLPLADTSHFCVKRPPNVMGGGLFVALVVCLKSTAGYAGRMQGDRSLSIYLGDRIGGFAQV